MTFELVSEQNIDAAAEIHSVSWKESHKDFCTYEFVQAHTKKRQRQYIEREMEIGKRFYLLLDNGAKGIVSVTGDVIGDLYVLPSEQSKGYGTKLLEFAENMCSSKTKLWVLSNNARAIKLYKKLGYMFTDNKKILRDDLQELEMEKRR